MNLISNQEAFIESPLVSVALCTFNGATYIRSQLDSIICQTYHPLQIIITDDASTDDTADIIREYATTDSRIIYSINSKNLGYNKNFEKTIGLCEADFIAISDQDDVWEKNKIELMMNKWPAGSLFIYSLSGSFTGNDFNNRKAAPAIVYSDISDVHQLVFNSPVHGHAIMMKKSLYTMSNPFPADIFYDWWLSMHAAANGIIGCIPLTLTWHRVHENNSSRNIVAIKEANIRNEQLRQQSVYFIETFCLRATLQLEQKESILYYASLLKKMDGKRFSWPMFWYVMKQRKKIFHYKKQKPFIFLSYLKHAIRMAYKGLL